MNKRPDIDEVVEGMLDEFRKHFTLPDVALEMFGAVLKDVVLQERKLSASDLAKFRVKVAKLIGGWHGSEQFTKAMAAQKIVSARLAGYKIVRREARAIALAVEALAADELDTNNIPLDAPEIEGIASDVQNKPDEGTEVSNQRRH